jgi:very-short-patch-repair endonuclease
MGREINIRVDRRRENGSREADAWIAAIAARQHGVIARAQLLALGLSDAAIVRRIRSGRLHVVHRGVYAVGHPAISREGELLAAVFGGGPGAVLSHESAAELWELLLAKGRLIDVTASSARTRPGIRFHRCELEERDITERKAIPVTTPERTIVDLAPRLTPSRLEHVIRQAEYEHLTTATSLASCLSTHGGRRGMKSLRKALGLSAETPGVARSELERRFLRFIRRHGLLRPHLNYPLELPTRDVKIDCAWPERRLAVELDSRRAHDNRHSFESDRARDRDLLVAGWIPTRVTWRQLHEDEARLAADLSALLA